MTKKSRRVRRKKSGLRLSESQLAQPTMLETPQTVEAPVAVKSSAKATGINFSEEYHYVVSDLKKIGILAAVILGSLVALAFIV